MLDNSCSLWAWQWKVSWWKVVSPSVCEAWMVGAVGDNLSSTILPFTPLVSETREWTWLGLEDGRTMGQGDQGHVQKVCMNRPTSTVCPVSFSCTHVFLVWLWSDRTKMCWSYGILFQRRKNCPEGGSAPLLLHIKHNVECNYNMFKSFLRYHSIQGPEKKTTKGPWHLWNRMEVTLFLPTLTVQYF